MKKIFALFILLSVFSIVSDVSAKDYTKINTRAIKKTQKFTQTRIYTESMDKISTQNTSVVKNIKDPKLLKVADYEVLTQAQIDEKLKSDKEFYKKYINDFKKVRSDNRNKRAYARDYTKLYKTVDRLARANNLAYMNFRVVFISDYETFNAYSADNNCIAVYSALYDTLADNDDALAFVIAHEMGHLMLGHLQRMNEMNKRTYEIARINTGATYRLKRLADLKEFRGMEFAADLEAAKLLLRAGYDLDKAAEAISFMNAMYDSHQAEYRSTHPLGKKRVENIAQNRKYFVEEQWKEIGLYNWYKSEPLTARVSSDRASLIFGRDGNLSNQDYFRPETLEQIYTRYAYKSYLYGEYKEALKYLDKLISINPDNFAPYLYASYANEYLYKETGNQHYLELSKTYANSAKRLAPNNKYVIEQAECL
ncbi:MAG: M48 family metallopeptidase [Candidatus Gastranaerophilales bacterium]|nr:M48 family metallopeptidase [Candidatus Gastranaerophilales bacterium]